MIVREYKPEDKEAIERCIFELQEEEYERQPEYWEKPFKALGENYFEYLLKWMKDGDGTLFVAEIEGEVAGYVAIAIDEGKESSPSSPCIAMKRMGYIPDLVVLKKYHNISLDVTTGNSALDFYYKHGYKDYSRNLKKKL